MLPNPGMPTCHRYFPELAHDIHWLNRTNLNDVLIELAGSSFDENATIEEALQKLNLPDTHTRLTAMSSVLLPHQILGVAWMREREVHTYVDSAIKSGTAPCNFHLHT